MLKGLPYKIYLKNHDYFIPEGLRFKVPHVNCKTHTLKIDIKEDQPTKASKASQTIEVSVRLSSIVKSSNDAIISKKFDGTINSWNEAAQKIFGYTAEEAIDKNISILVPEELYNEAAEIISKVKKGEMIEHYETLCKTKKDNKIPIALTISPIR